MAEIDLAAVREQLDEIYQSYATNFSGRPRATRDPQILQQLIARLEGALDNANKLLNGSRNPAIMQIIDSANQNLNRYIDEVKAIKSVKGDPRIVFAAELAEQANRIFDHYQRHFGGKDRGTRDVLLLNRLADDLNVLEAKMAQLVDADVAQSVGDRETVVTQLRMYREEISNIKQARKSGSNEDIANRLAQIANEQFATYRAHYSGKSRVSRSSKRLERMISNLKTFAREMKGVRKSGFRSEMNEKNIEVVEQNLKMYRNELDAVNEAKAETAVRDYAGALGGAANDLFNDYRDAFAGKNRSQVDPQTLSLICDGLFDIADQMREISDEIDIDINEQNLGIVEENLAAYEREFVAIIEAQENA